MLCSLSSSFPFRRRNATLLVAAVFDVTDVSMIMMMFKPSSFSDTSSPLGFQSLILISWSIDSVFSIEVSRIHWRSKSRKNKGDTRNVDDVVLVFVEKSWSNSKSSGRNPKNLWPQPFHHPWLLNNWLGCRVRQELLTKFKWQRRMKSEVSTWDHENNKLLLLFLWPTWSQNRSIHSSRENSNSLDRIKACCSRECTEYEVKATMISYSGQTTWTGISEKEEVTHACEKWMVSDKVKLHE